MEYYFTKTLDIPFGQALELARKALQKKGFGIISEIDMQATFREKLHVAFKNYTILGACNPSFAYQALVAEEKIGTMLPCNVLVIEKGDCITEIAAVNPLSSMVAVKNNQLEKIAGEVTNLLREAIESLEGKAI